MKISKLEFVTVLLTAAFLAFAMGWFLRSSTAARPVLIETERTLTPAEQSPIAIPAPSEGKAARININTASAGELETLPGIGPRRAADIIAYREANGPFRIPEDMTKVSGIGESTMEGLIDFITTGG
jgi:competence protein ComEA